MRRCDPLIDLALAQFTENREVATTLFNKGGDLSEAGLAESGSRDGTDTHLALRLSVLSNMHVNISQIVGNVPQWLPTASEAEILSLFLNPRFENKDVLDFLEGKGSWQVLSESCRQKVVVNLSYTQRMGCDVEQGEFNGLEQFYRRRIHEQCWALSETMPNTAEWASTLSSTFERLYLPKYQEATQAKRWLDAAERWLPVVPAGKSDDTTELANWSRLGVRLRLTELALSADPTIKGDMLSHDDKAVRLAVYRRSDLSLQEMREAFAKDKEDAYNALVANENLWRNTDQRNLLDALACEAGEALGDESWQVARYRTIEEGMRDNHPDWFVADAEQEKPPRIEAELLAAATQLRSEFRDFKKKALYVAVAIFVVILWQQLAR